MKHAPFKRPLVALDVDGVIGDLGTALLAYNKDRGIVPADATLAGLKRYRLEETFPGFSFECFDDATFWASVSPYPGSRQFVDALKERFRIIFISSCRAQDARNAWLRKHGFGEFYIDCRPQHKASAAASLGVWAFVEDHPDTLKDLTRTNIHALGIEWGYNAHLSPRVFMRPVEHYGEIVDELIRRNI